MKLRFLEPSIEHIQHKKSTVISKNYGGILAESKGFDLRCGAGRLGVQSAPGALLRALGFESQRFLLYTKAPAYDGSFCVWRRVRDSNPCGVAA